MPMLSAAHPAGFAPPAPARLPFAWPHGSEDRGAEALRPTIGVIKRVPAPPPSRNQQAATLSSPPPARSCARRTYSFAKPWLPCRSKILGKGPVPLGRATAAIKPPTSGTVMLIHWASSFSVPAGRSNRNYWLRSHQSWSHRSPGHHVEGGSLAVILVVRSATRWLRLYG